MKFPLLNISEQKWEDEDLIEYLLFDELIYTDDQVVFKKYFEEKSFCDCNGVIFKVKNKILPDAWWRKAFKFLPNVYKITLTFEKTGEKINVDQLKIYVLKMIDGLSENEFRTKWIADVKKAKTHEQIIAGEMK